MKYFSMPADFKNTTIDKYEALNKKYQDSKVGEIYGNVTLKNSFESGRSVDMLPEVDFSTLEKHVAYAQERGMQFNYTLNMSHMANREFSSKGLIELMMFLGKLYKAGIRSLTVALPSLMEIIRESDYDFNIKASVICQVTTPNKALAFKKMGAKRIVVDESVVRDFENLKRITKAAEGKLEVIINSICFRDCPYRIFHYNQISTDSIELSSKASSNYYDHRCLLRRFENKGSLLRLSWVRPEDIKYYTRIGINYFKIQGRHTVMQGDPARAVEYYFKESYDGDLVELFDLFNLTSQFRMSMDNRSLDGFLKPFVQDETFCRNDCNNCKHCEHFAEKCIDLDMMKESSQKADTFYSEYDQFAQVMKEMKQDNSSQKEESADLTADFDLL
jgi:collagenase-like PrtC family protease